MVLNDLRMFLKDFFVGNLVFVLVMFYSGDFFSVKYFYMLFFE